MRGGHRLGTLLSVWAHPDDETYLCAGLMAAAVEAGDRVVCVTATRGELGSSDPDRWPSGPPLAEVRTRELAEALGILGVADHRFLDYPDGGCADVDQDEAVDRLQAIVAEVQPDTVLTFGPDGMTGHADHQAVSRWTAAAVAGSGAALHWSTHTPGWVQAYEEAIDRAGTMMGGSIPCTPEEELSIHAVLDGDLLDRKLAALLCQASQVGPMLETLGLEGLRTGIAEEAFQPAR